MREFKLFVITIVFVIFGPAQISAQQIDISVVRAAGAICGAGFSVEVQGELDARINRLFGGVGASGDTVLDVGQASQLLEVFAEDERSEAFKTYVDCVVQTVNAVTGVSESAQSIDQGREVIDSSLVPDPLAIIKSGDRFQMALGDSRAIERQTLLVSAYRTGTLGNGQKFVEITISDVVIATSESIRVTQAQTVKVGSDCTLNPYAIDVDAELVSFVAVCQG